jgi:hypothetical protein
VLVSTGQLLLASALLEEILFMLKPFLVDSLNKKPSPGIQPTSLMDPLSEGSPDMEIAVTSYSRLVLPYYAVATVFLYF